MTLAVCSLKKTDDGNIQPDTWTDIRFGNEESYDPYNMHPDIFTGDPESALILPAHQNRFGYWKRMVVFKAWAHGPEVLKWRFARHRIGGTLDTTATHVMSPIAAGRVLSQVGGWDFFTDDPVSIQVWHDAPSAIVLDLAEFKLSYTI